jgi:hypothetical protein
MEHIRRSLQQAAADLRPGRRRQTSPRHTVEDWETDRDVAELCPIIARALAEMGIAVEEQEGGSGACLYMGKSPLGMVVTVKAEAIIQGRSFVQVQTPSDRLGHRLGDEVSRALRMAENQARARSESR